MGTSSPRFNSRGKIWKRSGDLSNHLRMVDLDDYQDCEIVVLELVEADIIRIVKWMDDLDARRDRKLNQQLQRELNSRLEQARLEMEESKLRYIELQRQALLS